MGWRFHYVVPLFQQSQRMSERNEDVEKHQLVIPPAGELLCFLLGFFLFKHLYQNSREPLGLSIKVSGAFLQTFPLQTCTKSPNTYVWWSCELQRPDQAHRSASNHTFPSYWSYCCVKKKVRSPLYTFMNWLASFWLIRSSPRTPILGKSWMFRSHMQLYSPVL